MKSCIQLKLWPVILPAGSPLAVIKTNDNCSRTVVGIGFCADTPVDVIALRWIVDGFVTLIGIAETFAAGCLATTVVVGNDVPFTVDRVFTGSYPGNR